MLSVEEARRRVLEAVTPMGAESLAIGDAHGRVLATDVITPHQLPRFDNSAMDGYAVRADDVRGATADAPAVLRVAGEVRAGDPGELKVLPGEAVRIMTGAPLPAGADAIVPVEVTEETDDRVAIRAPSSASTHVRPAGEDLDAGDLVARAGTELGPGELAVLASVGASPVSVHAVPGVAILVTGDELVDPEQDPAPGQIRDSNSVALAALVHAAGAEVVSAARVPDERERVVAAFSDAAKTADLVLSSGGVAVGRYDFVKEVVEELGRLDLWRVAMQPGKPVVLGAVLDKPFLGLPGNPVSIHVGFEQFVRPALRKMRGCRELLRPTMIATLADTITKRPGRLHFVRVRLAWSDDGLTATPTGPQGSHIQSSLVECDGVARFDADLSELPAGSPVTVEVWRLPGSAA